STKFRPALIAHCRRKLTMSTFYDENELDDNVPLTGNLFHRLLGIIKPHWRIMTAGMFGISLVAISDAVFTYLQKEIIDRAIIAGDQSVLLQLFTYYIWLVVIQSVAVFVFVYFVGKQGELVRYDLRKKLFNHLQKLSLAYFSKTPLGWIMSRV